MIAGDFNLKSKAWDIRYDKNDDSYVENLNEFMECFELNCINDPTKATHCCYEIIDGIPVITKYNSLDLVLISSSLLKQCTDFDTNSNNVYDGSENGCDVINSELDLEWITNVSDHFIMSWNMNNENKDNIVLKETWRLNSDKWNEYRASLVVGLNLLFEFIFNNIYDINGNDEMNDFIDIITDKLAKQIRVSAKGTIGRKKFDERSKPWMSKELKDMINLCKKYRRKKQNLVKKGKKRTLQYKILKKQLNYYNKLKNKLLDISQKHLWYQVGKNESLNDSKKLYQSYNCLAERNRDLPPMLKEDGSYTDDTIEKAERMHAYFTRSFKQNHYSDDIKEYHRLVSDFIDNLNPDLKWESDCNFKLLNLLNRNITEQEIWKSIKALKRKNAMGCDQIHNVMIIEGIEELMPLLLLLFNLMLNYGKHPPS